MRIIPAFSMLVSISKWENVLKSTWSLVLMRPVQNQVTKTLPGLAQSFSSIIDALNFLMLLHYPLWRWCLSCHLWKCGCPTCAEELKNSPHFLWWVNRNSQNLQSLKILNSIVLIMDNIQQMQYLIYWKWLCSLIKQKKSITWFTKAPL